MSKVLWHTINIQIPDTMINISKSGKLLIKSPLTKTGNLSKSNHESSIIVTTNHNISKPRIISEGIEQDEAELRRRQNQLGVIKKRLSKLPNKPKTTKAQFIAKAKAHIAHKLKKNNIIKLKKTPNIENIVNEIQSYVAKAPKFRIKKNQPIEEDEWYKAIKENELNQHQDEEGGKEIDDLISEVKQMLINNKYKFNGQIHNYIINELVKMGFGRANSTDFIREYIGSLNKKNKVEFFN